MHMNLKPNKHKIISLNTTIMTSLGFIIVGTTARPCPPLIKGGGGATLLLYSSIIFTVCAGKLRFPLLFFGSSVF